MRKTRNRLKHKGNPTVKNKTKRKITKRQKGGVAPDFGVENFAKLRRTLERAFEALSGEDQKLKGYLRKLLNYTRESIRFGVYSVDALSEYLQEIFTFSDKVVPYLTPTGADTKDIGIIRQLLTHDLVPLVREIEDHLMEEYKKLAFQHLDTILDTLSHIDSSLLERRNKGQQERSDSEGFVLYFNQYHALARSLRTDYRPKDLRKFRFKIEGIYNWFKRMELALRADESEIAEARQALSAAQTSEEDALPPAAQTGQPRTFPPPAPNRQEEARSNRQAAQTGQEEARSNRQANEDQILQRIRALEDQLHTEQEEGRITRDEVGYVDAIFSKLFFESKNMVFYVDKEQAIHDSRS